jgi:RHS repeat-associated protein
LRYAKGITPLGASIRNNNMMGKEITMITSSTQFFYRNYRISSVLVLLAIALTGVLWSRPAHAQFQCTADGVVPGSKCQSSQIDDWRWFTSDVAPSLNGIYFRSEAELSNAIVAVKQASLGSIFCSISAPTPGAATAQSFYVDQLVYYVYTLNYSLTWKSNGIDCNVTQPYTPQVVKERSPYCAANWITITTSTDGYCACPWGSTSCPTKLQFQGHICKADPCTITTGNQHEIETDYRTGVPGGLQFVRAYNSNYAYLHYKGSSWTFRRAEPMGIGWAATYLQNVSYNPVAGHPGLTAYRPDGSELTFNQLADGSFNFGSEIGDRVSKVLDGSNIQIGWKYITDADDTEMYDLHGRLLSITSRSGIVHTLAYDSNNKLASVTDSFGHVLGFAWNSSGQLQSLTLPDNTQISYSYDANNNLTSATYPGTTARTYVYGLNSGQTVNLLTAIQDESNIAYVSWAYDINTGWVTSSQQAGGVGLYTFSHSLPNYTVIDPLNKARTYATTNIQGYPRYASASAVCPGCGEFSSVGYDSKGNMNHRVDFNGNVTDSVFDTTRTLETSRTEALGTPKARTITTTWHPTFRLPATIAEPNRTTAFTYDVNGNVLTKTITDTAAAISRTWTYTYNSFGQMLTADGPRTDISDLTAYTYYNCSTGFQCGQINTITNAASQVTTFNTYNAHGQPLTITDPNGVVTTLAYDARRRLTLRQVGTETTTYDYWPTGLLKKVTLPDLSFVQYSYDAAHRLTDITDSVSNHIHYTLDAMGNRTAETAYDPSNVLHRTHTRVFNTLNQLYQDVNAAGTANVTTTFGYDPQGNQTTINAPLSRNTANQYDELNRLKQITDPGLGITQFQYDGNDNLTQVTDPRTLITSYQYNGFGDLKQQTSPDTGTTLNTYDSGGNLKTSTDARSKVATYSYDALNRVAQVAYADQTITFGYDAGINGKGRLTSAADASHSLSWTYDALGRVTGKGQTVGTVTKSLGYGYNGGRLVTLVLPSGQQVNYQYNANNQISGITLGTSAPVTILSSTVYEPFGPAKSWTWGNATTLSRSFDTDGKITQIATTGINVTNTYGYDDAFRITGIPDTGTAANSWTYGYDSRDRITSGAKTGTTRGWTYDANGNRLTETGSAASTYTVSATNNRVSSITGALPRTYTYDAAGNTLTYATVTATYNNRGRMKTLKKGAPTETLVYNALGQMVKTSGGALGTELFMYDEAGHLIGEYSSTGTLIQETVWLGDIPVATLRPNGSTGCTSTICIFYVHTDHLNAPRRVSRGSDNKLLWTWLSDPFGTTAANENPAAVGVFKFNLRFPGQIADSQAGLSQNYFRDYDPAVGRYPESDPIGLRGGINTYAYVGGNPISNIDPRGLETGAAMASISRAEGLVPPGPPGYVSSEVKAYLCKYISDCKGNLQCVWQKTNADRHRKNSWGIPTYRQGENWAYAAGWNEWQSWPISIDLHQLLKYIPGLNTTPASFDAWLAGMEGRFHQQDTPADLNKWCNGCGSK